MFGKYGFYRCHPLYVVNLRKVFKVEENSLIIATGNESTKIPLDPRKYNVVKQRFMEVE
jgi:two-component system LytT family response regulator